MVKKRIIKKPKIYVTTTGRQYIKIGNKKVYITKGVTERDLIKFIIKKLAPKRRKRANTIKGTSSNITGIKSNVLVGDSNTMFLENQLKRAKQVAEDLKAIPKHKLLMPPKPKAVLRLRNKSDSSTDSTDSESDADLNKRITFNGRRVTLKQLLESASNEVLHQNMSASKAKVKAELSDKQLRRTIKSKVMSSLYGAREAYNMAVRSGMADKVQTENGAMLPAKQLYKVIEDEGIADMHMVEHLVDSVLDNEKQDLSAQKFKKFITNEQKAYNRRIYHDTAMAPNSSETDADDSEPIQVIDMKAPATLTPVSKRTRAKTRTKTRSTAVPVFTQNPYMDPQKSDEKNDLDLSIDIEQSMKQRLDELESQMQSSAVDADTMSEYNRIKADYDELQAGKGKKKQKKKPDVEKGLSTSQIDKIMHKYPEYLGTIAFDEIPLIIDKLRKDKIKHKKICFTMNTDPSHKKGEHWFAVLIDLNQNANTLEIYDSLADPLPKGLLKNLKPLLRQMGANNYIKLKVNMIPDQDDSSANCGYFASRFLIDRLRGKTFSEATKYDEMKTLSTKKGEERIEKWKNTLSPFKYISPLNKGETFGKGIWWNKSGQRIDENGYLLK
jgi:rubrerythrin